MKVMGLGKGYVYALLFFVLPVGGLLIYAKKQETGAHSVILNIQKDGTFKMDEHCSPAPGFDNFIEKLNEINKPFNIVCKPAGDLTTMSKMIQCEIMHGRAQGMVYWAENLKECDRIKNTQNKK